VLLPTERSKADVKRIPYSDTLSYPKDWPDLSARRDQTVHEERPIGGAGPFDTRASGQQGEQAREARDRGGQAGDEKKKSSAYDVAERLSELEKVSETLKKRVDPAGAKKLEAEELRKNDSDAKAGDKENGALAFHAFKPSELSRSESADVSGKSREGAAHGAEGTSNRELKSGTEAAPVRIAGVSQPGPGNAPAPAPTPPAKPAGEQPATPVPEPAAPVRKVIRSGNVEFEVDSFDSALMTVTKLVIEDGGFVASTDSAKGTNGKVSGTVTIRIPPDRLDAFVLKLRGLGDLKNQKITSQDVSKSYSDTESALRAARAMEERLLDMIKKGQGQIKDLLAAEKELGIWREKIEQLEGEKRYYDNLIGLSTLVVSLQERDIKAAAGSLETETIEAGIETDNVEKARADLIKAIDDAKGRITASDLKQLDAGQFAATITAEVDADKAGPVIDRLKQLGKVARFTADRRQTAVDGSSPPAVGAHTEKKATLLKVSLYNLANVEPRLTTSARIAVADVETVYRSLMTSVEKAGGRVVSSNLERPRPDEPRAVLRVQTPSASAGDFETAFKNAGETLNIQLSENPDTANVTTAKQGFVVEVVALAYVPPRLTATLTLAAEDVEKTYRALIETAEKSSGRVVASSMQRPAADQLTAVLQLEVPRDQVPAFEATLGTAAELMRSNIAETGDRANSTKSKQAYDLRLLTASAVSARQSSLIQLATKDVPAAHKALAAIGEKKGVRIVQSSVTEGDRDHVTAVLTLDVPRTLLSDWEKSLASTGDILTRSVTQSNDTQNTLDSKVRFDLRLYDADHIEPRQRTSATVRVDSAASTQASYMALAQKLGGKIISQDVSRDPNGRENATLSIDVPRDSASQVIGQLRSDGELQSLNTSTEQRAPDGKLARARFDLTFTEREALVGKESGFWSSIQGGLSTSLRGLAYSVRVIVVGLCFVVPWVLILWIGWRLIRRARGRRTPPPLTA
jgi:hypothetical protein